MKFGSLFSGIGGFDLGFERAGLECAWQVEIDKDCARVLSKHWPNVERFEDVTKCGRMPDVDVLCGGFPCQDLSVAGQREGLAGERSGLWYEFLRIIESNRPRIVVIENVPGLLSSDEGRDFAIILRGLVKCGYGVSWRVLDAQYFGLAQRRKRLFIVGSLGDGSSAEILFESDSMSWNPPTRGEERERVANAVTTGTGKSVGPRNGNGDPLHLINVAATLKQRGRGACDEVIDNLQIAGTLAAHAKKHGHAMTTQQSAESNQLVSMPLKAKANSSHDESHETYVVDRLEHHRFNCLTCGQWFGVNDYDEQIVTCPKCGETHIDKITDVLDSRTAIAYRTSGNCGPFEQGDKTAALNTATDRNQNIIAFASKDCGEDAGKIAPTLRAQNSKDSHQNGGGQVAIAFRACGQDGFTPSQEVTPPIAATDGGGANAPTIAFTERTRSEGRTFEAQEELAYAITNPGSGGRTHSRQVAGQFGVRRLTPRECERLQGFPDDWTLYDASGHIISDSARYRMLGNAVAVPVAEWIAKRILRCLGCSTG